MSLASFFIFHAEKRRQHVFGCVARHWRNSISFPATYRCFAGVEGSLLCHSITTRAPVVPVPSYYYFFSSSSGANEKVYFMTTFCSPATFIQIEILSLHEVIEFWDYISLRIIAGEERRPNGFHLRYSSASDNWTEIASGVIYRFRGILLGANCRFGVRCPVGAGDEVRQGEHQRTEPHKRDSDSDPARLRRSLSAAEVSHRHQAHERRDVVAARHQPRLRRS